MPKIDYRRRILPDIEMYGGSTDLWEIPLYRDEGDHVSYTDAQNFVYKLVIKDYGYQHRTNGSSYFTLVKSGFLTYEEDGTATLCFRFAKNDTFDRYGKFTYQVIAESQVYDLRNVAQGNLYITKAIDQ